MDIDVFRAIRFPKYSEHGRDEGCVDDEFGIPAWEVEREQL